MRTITLSLLLCSHAWAAATLTIGGNPFPNGVTQETSTSPQTDCTNLAGMILGANCLDTAFVSASLANPSTTFISPATFNGIRPTFETFSTAFNNAVSTPSTLFQGNLLGWRMVDGGTLDLRINILSFGAAQASKMAAGMVIRLVPSDYDPAMQPDLARGVTAPEPDQLVWTQGLYINWQPNGTQATLMNPANTLDDYTFNTGGAGMPVPGVMGAFGMAALNIPATPANASYSSGITNIAPGMPLQAYQDPIYMFQGPLVGGFNRFFDGPNLPYETPASFRGIALLSAVNTTTKTLTVFNNGVSYGFDLSVTPSPEPSMMVVSSLVVAGMVWAHRRRRRS
jgi:hypothetical protein